ncbi:MAG TPA: hemerythrin domain-containing protein [Burkholderiaceae bacterium]|nr:hemerythrin domain-containing protein [Burkholderiaceae bacterium]
MNDAIGYGAPPSEIGFFAVGYAPMDDLHEEFRDLLVALASPDASDYGLALVAMHEHLLRHCAAEEAWMRENEFPAYDCHKREHDMLLEVVSEVRRRYDAGDNEIVTRLATELPHWFEEHANTMDAALAFFLKERAGPPVAGEVEVELA